MPDSSPRSTAIPKPSSRPTVQSRRATDRGSLQTGSASSSRQPRPLSVRQDSEANRLRERVASLEKKLQIVEANKKSSETENRKLSTLNASLQASFDEKASENAGMKKQIDQRAKQVIEAEHKLKRVQGKADKVDGLEAQLTRAKKEIEEYKETVSALPGLEKHNRQLQAQLDAASKGSSPMSRRSVTLSQVSAAAQAKIIELEEQLAIAQADAEVASTSETYVKQLESFNQGLHRKYAAAIKEFDEKNALISHWQNEASKLTQEVAELEIWRAAANTPPQQETPMKVVYPCPQGGLIELEATEAMKPAMVSTAVQTTSTKIKKAPVAHASLQTGDSKSSDYVMVDTGLQIGAAEPVERVVVNGGNRTELSDTKKPKMISSGFQTSALLQDVSITIQINPEDRKGWTLLKRVQAAVSKNSGIEVYGPDHLVKELLTKMEQAQAEDARNVKKVSELRENVWNYVHEIERLKTSVCNKPSHRNLADQVAAKDAQIAMQDTLLASYGRDLSANRGHR